MKFGEMFRMLLCAASLPSCGALAATFDVRDFGAKGDGVTKGTAASWPSVRRIGR